MKEPWKPLPFVGDCYSDSASPWSDQDTVNYWPVRAERGGTRDEWKFATPVGAYPIGTIGDGPHRGGHDVEGRPFVVSGRALYEIKTDGSVHNRGVIPGYGRVTMSHNNAGQLTIGTNSSGYVFNLNTNTLSQITDDGFPGFWQNFFDGQYTLGIGPTREFWFHSALNDSTAYNTNDRYQAEASPDRLVGGVPVGGQVLFLGDRTGEVFVNVPVVDELGIVTASYQRSQGILIEHGLAAVHSLIKIDGVAFWVGDNGKGYRWAGNEPVAVTTQPIEEAWAKCDLRGAFSLAYEENGFTHWLVTFPDGQTWGYDLKQNAWHRRESYGLKRWRMATLFKSNGRWYAGDYANGTLYLLDEHWYGEGITDDGEPGPMLSERAGGVGHDFGRRVFWDGLQLELDSGIKAQEPDHVDLWDAITIAPPAADMLLADNIYHTYTQTGATGSVTWTITTGAAPDGLALADPDDTTVSLSGTPTTDDTFTFTLRCTEDATGHYGELVESIVVSPQYFAFATSEVDLTRIGYGKFNPYSGAFTELATLDRDGYHAIGNPGCVIDGKLVGRVEFDNTNSAPNQQSGLHLLAYDGTSTLDTLDFWQYSTAEDHDYLDHVAYDDTTVACVLVEGVDLKTKLCAVGVSGSTLATVGSAFELRASSGEDYSLCMHNGVLMALDFDVTTKSLRALTFDGSVWTVEGTCGDTLTGSFGSTLSPMVSNGDFLFLSNGMIFSYDAGTFTLIDTATLSGVGNVIGVFEYGGSTVVVYQDGTTDFKAFTFDGVTATLSDTLTQTVAAASRGACLSGTLYAGQFILPGTTPSPDANSGWFRYNGAIARQGTVELSGGATYAAVTQITQLVQA